MWFTLVLVLAATPLACGGGDRSAEDAMVGDVALGPDGKIVVAGSPLTNKLAIDVALLRLTADGRPNPTFTGGR